VSARSRSRWYSPGKRALDVVVSVVVLLVAAPVMLVIAAAVALTMGRPVLFRQIRPGQGAELFELVKFRSMVTDDSAPYPASDGARLTRLGRWLRATSLDELPTFWNVLKGDMSLVGPRPLLLRYLDRYTPEQFRRHRVRPGITGLQQVNGRNALSWEERFAYDTWYVDHRSFALDLRILARTVVTVLRREGITAPGSATAHEFLGSRERVTVGSESGTARH
jgi:lipopolysaccharide/colanic/teichoic acid biosynthesis glycosyltransferase